jgi:ABC-type dipeptide/oligopeptide/nickel transport system permease subunit
MSDTRYRRERRHRRLLQYSPAIAASVLLLMIVLAAVLAPTLVSEDPLLQVLDRRLQAPVWLGGPGGHLLGTDHL